MSDYRLTEAQEKILNLTAITWEEVRKLGIYKVYIKANSTSVTYGPYLVKDANKCMIAKMDGTDPRCYPRDKGLLISGWAVTSNPAQGYKVDRFTQDGSVLEAMTSELLKSIEEKQQELKVLQHRYEVLSRLIKLG
jgi:hypothetical protein